MSLPTHISRVAINVVLDVLFPLLLTAAGGSQEAARQAALDLLAEYHPNTAEELGLAGEIIAFRFKALGALRDSAEPGALPATARDLMKIAAMLRRNEAGAQRKLDALQRARRVTAKKPDATTQPTIAKSQPAAPDAAKPAAAPATKPAIVPPSPQQSQTPARRTETPAKNPSRMDVFVQRLSDDLAGNRNGYGKSNELLTEIASAFSRGDHRGVFNAVAGSVSSSVAASALLSAA